MDDSATLAEPEAHIGAEEPEDGDPLTAKEGATTIESTEKEKDVENEAMDEEEDDNESEGKTSKSSSSKTKETVSKEDSKDGKSSSASYRSAEGSKEEPKPRKGIEKEAPETARRKETEKTPVKKTMAAIASAFGAGVTDTLKESLLEVAETTFTIEDHINYDKRTNRYTEPGPGKQTI